ncbi:hypothetical protein BDV98DRAFT_536976 [Pterulicium gracile]|uniref:Peptidase M14 domain-containing protein n=1 Tax=Pterulicium gracile TaxID=1884261 RepID=A0A5C3Q6Y5_9AGAR|nr:hypothetical protein BDV98DRAFT_536976 [Pterula gracilis]
MRSHSLPYVLAICSQWARASQIVFDSSASVNNVPEVENHGTLWNYQPLPNATVDQVRVLAEDLDLDIWHQAANTIQIYAPPYTTLPSSLLSQLAIPTTWSKVFTQPQLGQPLLGASENWNLSSLTNTTFHLTYHPLHEVDQFLRDLVKLHPRRSKLLNIGHSANGREMRGIKIAKDDEVERPAIVIMGAQHAREWIASASSLFIAHALLSSSDEAYSLSELLDRFEYHIIPLPNPDGYVHTWNKDRFWYKNRQVVEPKAKCVGLDMNRNWGYKWKPHARDQDPGFSLLGHRRPVDPCSHWYPGSRPFEAPETNNIANYVATLPDARGFLDLRSYGQIISAPYSYTCKRIDKDAEDQLEAALGAASAIYHTHGVHFQAGRLCETLYTAPGNVLDWMYQREGIKYSFAVHLRDTGTYGFTLPSEWIRPVGEETGVMLGYLTKFILANKK